MRPNALGLLAASLVLAVGFSVAGHHQQDPVDNAENAASGPFRDGLFQAKLDHQLGRKPHFRTGRWTSNSDRAAFLAGYQQVSAPFHADSVTESEAFRRGVNDGAEARDSQRPFSLKAKLSDSVEPVAATKTDASLSYVDGYQLGYYSDAGSLQSQLTPQNSNRY